MPDNRGFKWTCLVIHFWGEVIYLEYCKHVKITLELSK